MNREYYEDYFNKIINKNPKRLGITFETKNKKYFYDSGTGKVFECTLNEYTILKYIVSNLEISRVWEIGISENEVLETLDHIKELIEQENILHYPDYNMFNSQSPDYMNLIGKDIQQVILELTEECNLRCKYCIYNEGLNKFRDFSKKNMTWSIAKEALDYSLSNCKEELSVTFYGGEPLINYMLMKQCIQYVLENNNEKKINFGLTTNATLITEEMAEFFSSLERCIITVSIDGPKEIHNKNRVTHDNNGSFDKAMNGLKLLVEHMGEDKARRSININTVLSPPYTLEKMQELNEFFKSISWLPSGMIIRGTYVDKANCDDTINEELIDFYEKDIRITDPLSYWEMNTICENSDKDMIFGKNNTDLLRIQNRLISDKPIPIMNQNGCCVPGSRRLYVTTDGNFKVCERIGESPYIGNVKSGIDLKLVEKYYINDYAKASITDCANCWATHLCSLCFSGFYEKNGINAKLKKKLCYGQRCNTKNALVMYHQILETRPEYIQNICNL